MREHLSYCKSCDASLHDVDDLAVTMKSLAVEAPKSCCEGVRDSFDRVDDLWVAFGEHGLRMIGRGGSEDAFRASYAKKYGRPLERATLPANLKKEIENADAKHVDFSGMSDLEADVLKVLTRIPRGEVRTYGWVAQQAGHPKAVRAIGSVCARNAVPFVVPCHRVVPSTGGVGEYAFGRAMKRELLQREGVDVDAL
ncbi:MAG TPA: MGMT family protein, partial [Thermoanaerobaculia bacterium]|nr:MGMT family protein [Thermoanaerobaculia bacterium]